MNNNPTHYPRDELLKLDRRSFLTLLASLAASYPLTSLAEKRKIAAGGQLLEDPWLTIAAVQEHLFPAEADSPGASDIQALQYLQAMMQTPDADEEENQFIKQGAGWLNGIAQKTRSTNFINLSEADREQVLRQVEKSRAGERWLSLMLTFIVEALLTDPVYGGNPNGIGWNWLQHQPGYPRPPQDKMYFELGYQKPYTRTFRRTKA